MIHALVVQTETLFTSSLPSSISYRISCFPFLRMCVILRRELFGILMLVKWWFSKCVYGKSSFGILLLLYVDIAYRGQYLLTRIIHFRMVGWWDKPIFSLNICVFLFFRFHVKASSLLQTIHDTSHHGEEQDVNIYFYAIAQCYSSSSSQIRKGNFPSGKLSFGCLGTDSGKSGKILMLEL